MDLQLKQHTALVTGSHRGTGAIIAKTLMQEGASVLVHGLQPGQAEAAVAELGGGIPVTGDITSDAGADELFAAIAEYPVDILINNYGTADGGSWRTSSSEDWISRLPEKRPLGTASDPPSFTGHD